MVVTRRDLLLELARPAEALRLSNQHLKRSGGAPRATLHWPSHLLAKLLADQPPRSIGS